MGWLAAAAALAVVSSVTAAPFAERIPFNQPDGTAIMLWGEGDEFYAVFETLDGYTVTFSPATKAYHYAAVSADGSHLVPTAWQVGQGDPAALGLTKHLRISPAAAKKQVQERFKEWDDGMQVTARWNQMKAALQQSALDAKSPIEMAPPSFTTTGTKVGLTILIDFSDATATIPQASIIDFCNGDNYVGYGNNGSVKKYFSDNANALLTYTNIVTIYIRVPNPKTYYNDTSVADNCGTQGRLLINDAITAMKALPNYATTILPAFSGLTVDGSSQVIACNVFFAGARSGVWSSGLWPHSWVLASSVDLGSGKKVYKYQITDIASSLTLGTFCHENGHMLCGFPDIYDYDQLPGGGYDSKGGAGMFCLMNSGGSGGNPVQVCAYLKRAAGWATTINITSASNFTASVSASGADFNKFYRYQKPGVSTEYYLFENRQKTGRDSNLPASGVAVWHIDELGDRDNQSMLFNSSHQNYEATLVQADNLWHFQNNSNSGDANDLYYSGNTATAYKNRLSDASSPDARWWDGSFSGILIRNFSVSGNVMTFAIGSPVLQKPILNSEPSATAGTSNTISWIAGGMSATPDAGVSGIAVTMAKEGSATSGSGSESLAQVGSAKLLPDQTRAAGIVPLNSPSSTALVQLESASNIVAVPIGSAQLRPFKKSALLANESNPSVAEQASGADVVLYSNITAPYYSYAPGTTSEILDYGTSAGGTITSFKFAYCTSNSSPGTVTVRFYTGTTSSSRGTLLKTFALSGLTGSSDGGLYVFTGTYTLPGADQFALPSGAFGYSYQYGSAGTSLATASGGSGNEDAFWNNTSLSWFGGYPTYAYASFYMEMYAAPPAACDLQIAEVTRLAATATEHDSFSVNARVYNAGPASSAACNAALVLSTNNDANVSDDFAIGEVAVGSLASGASQWVQWSFSMPDLITGTNTVWPVIMVDNRNVVPETNESNTYNLGSTFSVSDAPTIYYAECASNSGFTSPQNSGWTNRTTWTFTGLASGQTNWYRVKAGQGPAGSRVESDWSNIESSMNDSVAPTFSNLVVNPSLAKLGNVVTNTFYASEPLSGNPTVTVNTHAASYVSSVTTNYTYSYTIQASDPNGDATIAITGSDLAGNSGSTTNTTALDVGKSTPTVTTWPTAPAITYGQALSASILSGGSASVAGSFAWQTPGTIPSAGTPSYPVIFTPTDTASYNTVTNNSVSVTVAKASQTITGFTPTNGSTFVTTNAPVLLATASSGLPVSFVVTNGPGALNGGTNLSFSATGCVSVVASQTGTVNWAAATSITNTFRVYGIYTLTIASLYGTPTPATGAYARVEGTVLTNAIVAPAPDVTTQYVGKGWSLTGVVATTSTQTNLVLTLTNNATLTWLWGTNYWFGRTNGLNGTVSGSTNGWYAYGGSVTVTATPNAYYHFESWSGDLSAPEASTNRFLTSVDRTRSVTANFAETLGTNGVPYKWLADYGWTNNFDIAATNDPDADGSATWKEWIAGTDPTNGLSVLRVTNLPPTLSGFVLRWPSASNRTYWVDRATNLINPGFENLTSNIPAVPPVNVYTDQTPGLEKAFYRIKVEKP